MTRSKLPEEWQMVIFFVRTKWCATLHVLRRHLTTLRSFQSLQLAQDQNLRFLKSQSFSFLKDHKHSSQRNSHGEFPLTPESTTTFRSDRLRTLKSWKWQKSVRFPGMVLARLFNQTQVVHETHLLFPPQRFNHRRAALCCSSKRHGNDSRPKQNKGALPCSLPDSSQAFYFFSSPS